jgi:hypothetical protein
MRLPPRTPLAVALPLTLAVALLAASCESGRALPVRIPLGDYVQALINHDCAHAVACRQMPDMASCLAATSVDLSQVLAAVSAGRLIYDGAAAVTCFTAPMACTLTAQLDVPKDPSCDRIFSGAQAEGGPCTETYECAGFGSCNIDPLTGCGGTPGCCTGTCGPPAAAPLPIGGDCSVAGSSCIAGALCLVSSGLCVASVAVGQPCDATTDKYCGLGLTCGPVASGTQQVCLARPAEGESCATLSTCDALDDYCDVGTRRCVPKIAVGEACPNGVDCVDYAECDGPTRTCVSNPKAGASCKPAGPACLGSLQCIHDFCALPAMAPVPVCP